MSKENLFGNICSHAYDTSDADSLFLFEMTEEERKMNQSNKAEMTTINDKCVIKQLDEIATEYAKAYPVIMLTMGQVLCGLVTKLGDQSHTEYNFTNIEPHPIQREVVYDKAKCQCTFDVIYSQDLKAGRDENGKRIFKLHTEDLYNLGQISVCCPDLYGKLIFVIEGQQRIARANTILLCGRALAIKHNLNPKIVESINKIILKADGKIRFSELTDSFQNDIWKEYAGEYDGKIAADNDINGLEKRLSMNQKDCEVDQLFSLYNKNLETRLAVAGGLNDLNELDSDDIDLEVREEAKEKVELELEKLIMKICITPIVVKQVPYRKASTEFRATNTTNIPVEDSAIICGSMLAEFRLRDEAEK